MNTLLFITLTVGFMVATFIMGEKWSNACVEKDKMQLDKFSTPNFLQKYQKNVNFFFCLMITCICCYIVGIFFSVHAAAAEFF